MKPEPADLVIEGGTVVTESWAGPATIVVRDGRVLSLLSPNVSTSSLGAARTIDATGRLVLPGAVDPHCHIAVPLGEFVTLDDFQTASLAALAGGTTTIVDFAIPTPDEHPMEALEAKLEMGRSSRCDYALHGCVAGTPSDIPGIVRDFVAAGVRTVKLFTTYRDLLMVGTETIEAVMTALAVASGLTYVHAEDNSLVEAAQDEAVRTGHIDAAGMAGTRPAAAEERAVAEVLAAAERTGAPVYFVHQSTPDVVDQVVRARQRGVRAFSESCPHYLILDDSVYAGDRPERYVCCPPIRDRVTVDGLVSRLVDGFLHTVGSDHCCYDSSQKALRAADVRAMPNGLPGVETRWPVVWDAFVASERMSAQRFVEVMATNPARLNGLFPRKGTIAPGSDADLVILDPSESRPVRVQDLHMQTDYTPYEGRDVTGWPSTVIARGRLVLDEGKLIDPGPVGEFLPAEPLTFD
ncbi:MAG: dihydropyrimidinase [Actinomycetota bacterium]|jgi:dihydropyrimidinase|nr:dihydropyrimidinase [Actinomycetota bacterium]